MQRTPVRASCSGCGELHTICSNGIFRSHKPCGNKVLAPLDAFRRHLTQSLTPVAEQDDSGGNDDMEGEERRYVSRLEANRRKQVNKADVKWAMEAAATIRKMDEVVDQQSFINGQYNGEINEEFSKLFVKLLKMTPPGKKCIEAVEEGDYDHNGIQLVDEVDLHYGRRRRYTKKTPDLDQSAANKQMEYVNRCLFVNRDLAKTISFLRSAGIMELATPGARQALAAKFAVERSEAPLEEDMPVWLRDMPAITGIPADKPMEYHEWEASQARDYIMGKKLGAGSDTWGYSFNNLQTLLRVESGILEPLRMMISI
jgi:hypothetical protein